MPTGFALLISNIASPTPDPPRRTALDGVAGETYSILKLPNPDEDAVVTLYRSISNRNRDAVTLDLVKRISGGHGGDAPRAMKILFATLKNKTLSGMNCKGPKDLQGNQIRWRGILQSPSMLQTFLDAGMPLDHVYPIDEDDYPGDYKTNCIDAWYWAISSGSTEVADQLLRANVKPGLPDYEDKYKEEEEVRS
jgi:hypothetical protein